MVQFRRLAAVDCAGTGIKDAPDAGYPGEIEKPGRAQQSAVDACCAAGADFRGAGRGEVDQPVEAPGGNLEFGRFPNQPLELRTASEVRCFGGEAPRVATEYAGADVGIEFVVGGGDCFQQPLAVKARAAGDEEARAGKLRPQAGRVPQDVLAVLAGNGW